MTENILESLVDLIAARVVDQLRPLLAAPEPASEEWRLLNVEQAAAALGRSDRWVRERAKRGDLPYVKLDGGAFAFELEDLQAFAAVRRVGGERRIRRAA